MPPFYADHNVAFQVVQLMRVSEYDITFTREQELERVSDAAQLLHVAIHERVLLTHNERDFLLLREAWILWSRSWKSLSSHAGVIVLPQKEHWPPRRALHGIGKVLDTMPSLSNELWRWKSSRDWHPYR